LLIHRASSSAGFAFIFSMVVAAAAMAGEAVVETVVCESFPDDASIVLTPVDDSPLNIEIADRLAMALRHAGYSVADSAALTLRFQATERGLRMPAKDRSLGQISGSGGGVSLNLNIWSSTKNSILGGRQRRRSGQFDAHLIVAMELDRTTDGRCVWRGEAGASLVGWQHSELAERLTWALADAFGKDVRLRRMELK